MITKIKHDATNQLALNLRPVTNEMVNDGMHVMMLLRCMKYEGLSSRVINEVKECLTSKSYYLLRDDHRPLTEEQIVSGISVIAQAGLQNYTFLSNLEATYGKQCSM